MKNIKDGEEQFYPDIARVAAKLTGEENEQRNIKLHSAAMPSIAEIEMILHEIVQILFPGFFSAHGLPRVSLRHRTTGALDVIFRALTKQVRLGMIYASDGEDDCNGCEERARELAAGFITRLPDVRDLLDSDVLAAYEGDPAAKSVSETIFCYPSIRIMTNHRIAHELYKLDVPILPRIISELGHSRTGIDIHPGASIGPEFFIDHGTGVVIGETAVIGTRCRLYQGVTLGALSFPKDDDGKLTKGQPRHPILEDRVTVYGGATILGRITIGHDSIIGGNVWLTKSVQPCSKVVQSHATTAASSEKLLGEGPCNQN